MNLLRLDGNGEVLRRLLLLTVGLGGKVELRLSGTDGRVIRQHGHSHRLIHELSKLRLVEDLLHGRRILDVISLSDASTNK